MIDFIDRVSSGKKIIKYENGTTETVTIENAEDATVEGTPINRENLMALQGFAKKDVDIIEDGNGDFTIIEKTPKNNHTLTTRIIENDNGTITITQVFVGEKTIKKSITISSDETKVNEVLL